MPVRPLSTNSLSVSGHPGGQLLRLLPGQLPTGTPGDARSHTREREAEGGAMIGFFVVVALGGVALVVQEFWPR